MSRLSYSGIGKGERREGGGKPVTRVTARILSRTVVALMTKNFLFAMLAIVCVIVVPRAGGVNIPNGSADAAIC